MENVMSYETECGCQQIQPEIKLTAPEVTTSAEPVGQQTTAPIISVYAESIRNVEINDGNADDISFVIQFNVTSYDAATDKSVNLQTQKYIKISKSAILQDAQAQFVNAPKIKVESKDAKRFRELAGIPNTKNFV